MKKTLVMIAVAALVLTVSVGAYAYRGGRMQQTGPQQGSMYGQRGGMMHGQRGGMMAAPGYKGGMTPENCPYVRGYGWNTWKNQSTATAPQMVTEEQAKTAAEEYIQKYLPGYTVETIEKDAWRPLYLAAIKGANDVEQQMVIHGFGGQVMRVFPKTAE